MPDGFTTTDRPTEDNETPCLRVVTAAELLAMKIPPRAYALHPALPIPGLAMLYAPRGMGKTYVALSIALAIASAGKALRWEAPTARRVLYIDGEMPAGQLQERLALLIRASPTVPTDTSLRFIASDLLPEGLPSLAREEVQAALAAHVADADVVILDNLSTLTGGLRENEADDWTDFQQWLLSLRRAGKLVLMVHHAGKNGGQRGTSRREDVLDTVIALRRPADYQPSQGARFEVHFEKARGIIGADAAAFEATLIESAEGGMTWTTTDLVDAQRDRAADLLSQGGLTIRDIAEEVGMSRSAVARLKKTLATEAAGGHG